MNHSFHWRKPSPKKQSKRRSLEDMGYRDLVKILDREFSLFIRMSAANITTGIVSCVTCGSIHHWKQITTGHYISRSHHSVRWNKRNVGPQCVKCNSFHGGEQYKMRAYLVSRWGEQEIKKIEALADMTKTESAYTLREKIIEYRKKNKELRIKHDA